MKRWYVHWPKTMKRCSVRNTLVRWLSGGVITVTFVAWATLASTDPLADLRASVSALDNRQYPAAIKELGPLAGRLPKLADYCAWFLASAEFGVKNYGATIKARDPIWKQNPSSPLAAKAYILA